MKILPEYLINIMPEMEEVVEELRLSVIDHIYDILNKLDIDELSADEIRQKLSVVGLSVDRMSEDWLPNGKFYKMYSLIKNNRTTLPAIDSIVKSGGQFELLWSDEFKKATEYNYKDIQIARHYYTGGIDGYFYVSGDVSRSTTGHISSSAVTALRSDILLSQAIPAGYTYLYVPWPRPLYPSDSDYYYNVNMLNFDRLQYVVNCTDWSNSDNYISTNTPASDKYYKDNKLPTGTPFWFDYHFTNGYTDEDNNYTPIAESGKFYDADDNPYLIPTKDCIRYELDESCKELGDINAVFPTRCYAHSLSKTSKPTIVESQSIEAATIDYTQKLILWSCSSTTETINRLQTFDIPRSTAQRMVNNLPAEFPFYITQSKYKEIIESLHEIGAVARVLTVHGDTQYIKFGLDEYYYPNRFKESHLWWSKQIPDFYINVQPLMQYVNCELWVLQTINAQWTSPVDIAEYVKPEYRLADVASNVNKHYEFLAAENDAIDDGTILQSDTQYGPYRFDALWDKSMHIHERENHVKVYRPVWNESSPIFSLSQSDNQSNHTRGSLLGWFSYKQDTTLTTNAQYNQLHDTSSVARYNDPHTSNVAHTNVDRPTLGRLDKVYSIYTSNNGTNKQFTGYIDLYLDSSYQMDPTNVYRLSNAFKMTDNLPQSISHDDLFLMADPSVNQISLCANDTSEHVVSYALYAKSKYHKLWLSHDKSDISVTQRTKLYSDSGSSLFFATNNNKYIKYNIVGIYNSQGIPVNAIGCSIDCNLSTEPNFDRKVVNAYLNVRSTLSGAYILATVEITDGSLPDLSPNYVAVYNQRTNESAIAKHIPMYNTYEIDNIVYSLNELYDADFVIKKNVLTRYYGDEIVTIYEDNDEQSYIADNMTFNTADDPDESSIEEWGFN